MADAGKAALHQVGGAQIFPVRGGKVVDNKQRFAVFFQAFGAPLGIFVPLGLDEGIKRPFWRPFSLSNPDLPHGKLGFLCRLLGNLLIIMAVFLHRAAPLADFGQSSDARNMPAIFI